MKKKKEKRIEVNSREIRINLDRLQKDVVRAYDSMKKVLPESIKKAEIKKFGNASHIILPKEYAGKKATVLINR